MLLPPGTAGIARKYEVLPPHTAGIAATVESSGGASSTERRAPSTVVSFFAVASIVVGEVAESDGGAARGAGRCSVEPMKDARLAELVCAMYNGTKVQRCKMGCGTRNTKTNYRQRRGKENRTK